MAVNQQVKKMVERVKYERGIKQREIADLLDVSNTYLSDIINGRAPINDKFSERVRNVFGLDLNDGSEDCSPILKDHRTFGGSADDGSVVTLPLIPIDAVAGFPGSDNDSIFLAQCDQYAVPEFTAKGAEYLIRVHGSSMMPTYSNGDILACRKIREITFFQWGNVYVIDTNQGVLVKRLFEDGENADNVICRSDNVESFPEFRMKKHEIRSLSIVIGLIRIE